MPAWTGIQSLALLMQLSGLPSSYEYSFKLKDQCQAVIAPGVDIIAPSKIPKSFSIPPGISSCDACTCIAIEYVRSTLEPLDVDFLYATETFSLAEHPASVVLPQD